MLGILILLWDIISLTICKVLGIVPKQFHKSFLYGPAFKLNHKVTDTLPSLPKAYLAMCRVCWRLTARRLVYNHTTSTNWIWCFPRDIMFVSNLFIPALVIVILLNIRQTFEIWIQKVTDISRKTGMLWKDCTRWVAVIRY